MFVGGATSSARGPQSTKRPESMRKRWFVAQFRAAKGAAARKSDEAAAVSFDAMASASVRRGAKGSERS